MTTTPAQIAEAFSGHRFADTYPHLASDVRWVQIGGPTLHGREAVMSACEASAGELVGVTTTFRTFRSIADAAAGAVVVESLADYVDPDGQTSTVACCDVYDFADERLVTITSYNLVPTDNQ